VKKECWLFLSKLIGASLILGWIWFAWWQEVYPDMLRPVAVPFFRLLGVKRWFLELLMHHYTSLIPYLALVIATPGHIKNYGRGLVAFFGGSGVIILGHLLMSAVVFFIVDAYGLGKTAYRLTVPVYLINDSFPLVLWLLFYHEILIKLFPLLRFSDSQSAR